ncbi:HD domain-containing protein [Jeotgalibacillus proteolyticus]|uniref:HD domain-containing protein n=1 Tax=Jeotgalibacillus proteolyticus TaxID=2082395 RepID=UPI003CF6C489
MYIKDDLYGAFTVEKVLEELILSEPVQRLKGVHQGGAGYMVNENWNVTRYEHSVGVMLLIRLLDGSLEEQIAGMLHDVSHTAFSHVVDAVFENQAEDYHEKIYTSVVKESVIPSILAKHGYHYEDILLDDSQWTLLEQPAPKLCADRVDYTLRDMYRYGHITLTEISRFLQDVKVLEGEMFLQSIESAEWIVETYFKEVIGFFMNPLNIYSNDRLANLLKLALTKHVLTAEDFLGRDEDVLAKIRATNDRELLNLLNQIHPNVRVREDKAQFDLHRKNKLRLLDPFVFINGQIISASEVSKNVEKMQKEAYKIAVAGVYVKILSS